MAQRMTDKQTDGQTNKYTNRTLSPIRADAKKGEKLDSKWSVVPLPCFDVFFDFAEEAGQQNNMLYGNNWGMGQGIGYQPVQGLRYRRS